MTFAESSDFPQTRKRFLSLDQERLRDEFAKTALRNGYAYVGMRQGAH